MINSWECCVGACAIMLRALTPVQLHMWHVLMGYMDFWPMSSFIQQANATAVRGRVLNCVTRLVYGGHDDDHEAEGLITTARLPCGHGLRPQARNQCRHVNALIAVSHSIFSNSDTRHDSEHSSPSATMNSLGIPYALATGTAPFKCSFLGDGQAVI